MVSNSVCVLCFPTKQKVGVSYFSFEKCNNVVKLRHFYGIIKISDFMISIDLFQSKVLGFT